MTTSILRSISDEDLDAKMDLHWRSLEASQQSWIVSLRGAARLSLSLWFCLLDLQWQCSFSLLSNREPPAPQRYLLSS